MASRDEHWHASVLAGGLISRVIVKRDRDGTWMARARLCDRSLRAFGDDSETGPHASHEAALHAGQVAVLKLYRASIGLQPVPEPVQMIAAHEPAGGYRSNALRQFVRAVRESRKILRPVVAPSRVSKAEVFA
ncbi:MAG TPA: hypothetical protein VGH80_13725 [Xanthomonadaceae bacterium]|jgi:hypothetical protein